MAFHLLAVDDEPDFLASLALLFQLEGFKVTLASHGQEALSLIDEGLRPDAILLDQRMPGLAGTDVLRRLREKGHDLPAVLVSARVDVAELAEQHGFDAWVLKPCSLDQLVENVRSVIQRRAR